MQYIGSYSKSEELYVVDIALSQLKLKTGDEWELTSKEIKFSTWKALEHYLRVKILIVYKSAYIIIENALR